jgi:hypothetical protein
MTRRYASILAMLLGLAACAAPSGGGGGGGGGGGYPPSGPARDLLSRQGQPATVLEQHLGPPDSVEKLDSGETIMSYLWSRTQTYGGYAVSMGGYSQLGTQYVPTQVVSLNCRARFTIGTNGLVQSIDLLGNGCMDMHR